MQAPWCKDVDESWPQPADNFQGISYLTQIRDNIDGRQIKEKAQLNHNTFNWTHIQNNNFVVVKSWF